MSDPVAVLIVVDTETGGLEPAEACIIELAAQVIEVHKGGLEPGPMFHILIKPDMPVGDKAAAVNGYTPEKWESALPPKVGLTAFTQWIDVLCKRYKVRPMWAGCNPVFDLKFFTSDCRRHDVIKPDGLSYRIIDVQSLCLPLLLRGEIDSLSLSSLRTWAGCEGDQTHTAHDDALDTCQVLGAFLYRGADVE